MAEQTLISVIIAYFNEKQYIREAIESVLDQSHPALEIIVVDDGSDERIDALVDDLIESHSRPIRYTHQKNAGLGAARNTGIAAASGEYIAFLDADDYWANDRLESQLAAFRANPMADIVAGYVRQFVSPELDEAARSRLHCPQQPMRGMTVTAMLIRRSVFERVGPFTTNRQIQEVVDWIARAQEAGCEIAVIDDVVLYRRLHKTNRSLTNEHWQADLARALKSMLNRRRENAEMD
jgi:glycosyltransferase involved in cell wall biosynthesis